MTGLSEAQRASIVDSTVAVNGWEGSIRSGKTIASLIRYAEYATHAPTGHLAILGWTLTTIERNVLDPLTNLHPSIVRHTKGSNWAHIMGREVQLIGFSDRRSEAVIRGLTLAGAYIDEATLMPEGTFVQLLGRLSVPGATLFFTTNPDAKTHWLHKKYLARIEELPDWRVFHFTMDDNPSLAPEYIAAKKREFTGLWYRRFILGEWVNAEGSIFDRFDSDRHVIPFAETPQIARVLAAGIDYGTTNPTSCVILGITAEQHPRLVVLDEYRHNPDTGGKLTDPEQSKRIRQFLAGRHHPQQTLPAVPYTVIDPAAASLKVQLQHDGHRGIWDATNTVLPGIQLVAALLATDQLLITDRCKALIDEMPAYVWDDKKTDLGIDAPVKLNDHSVDALRYAVATTEQLWRNALRFTPEVTSATHHRQPVAAA